MQSVYAEGIAIGNSISCGKQNFECIVAIGGDNSDKVYSPCGNCFSFYWNMHLTAML